jgi:hypothetical protein
VNTGLYNFSRAFFLAAVGFAIGHTMGFSRGVSVGLDQGQCLETEAQE